MASLRRLSGPSLVRDRASATFEDTVAVVNPAGVDLYPGTLVDGSDPLYFLGLFTAVDDKPCRDKFPDGCPLERAFCHEPSGECVAPYNCGDLGGLCDEPSEAGRRMRALCPDTCGCQFPYSGIALTDPKDGCSLDAAPTYFNHLRRIPTGACLEGDVVDNDCCTVCDYGSCAPGYTYAGQFAIDEETRSSTYPDFMPFCGKSYYCGNTCSY